MRGTLEPFSGETTPRHYSPCGITLDQSAPVLVQHPERIYDWLAEAGISLPEVLLVPLYIGGNPQGTLWVVSENVGHFDSGHARVLTELASFVGIALRIVRSEERLKKALAEQELVAHEMDHRAKNLFAMTGSLIRLSAKGATTADELARTLSGRLHALESAHGLVRRDFAGTTSALPTPNLTELVRAIVSPHDGAVNATASRCFIEGSPVECGERALNGMALIFHELATNAVKYGAMKSDTGRVNISWEQTEQQLVLRWIERDGPPLEAPPRKTGFGSVLVKNTVVQQFGGVIEQDWQTEGLAVTITVPIAALAH